MPLSGCDLGREEVRTMEKKEEQIELIKNMECVSCRKMFDCKGKPRDIDRCVNYEQRKDK